jgi:rare lipoprotein A
MKNPEAKPVSGQHKKGGRPYQVGLASWYGEDFHGKATASGEPYDMLDFTAAHMIIPLGTYVRVTNLRNGRSVVVKVNDRGPVVPGRIIDLSYNAARALNFSARGVQQVRLDLVSTPTQANRTVASLR